MVLVVGVQPVPGSGDGVSRAEARGRSREFGQDPVEAGAQDDVSDAADLRRPAEVPPRTHLQLADGEDQVDPDGEEALLVGVVVQLPHQVRGQGEQ